MVFGFERLPHEPVGGLTCGCIPDAHKAYRWVSRDFAMDATRWDIASRSVRYEREPLAWRRQCGRPACRGLYQGSDPERTADCCARRDAGLVHVHQQSVAKHTGDPTEGLN
jgi:hypothetical protein